MDIYNTDSQDWLTARVNLNIQNEEWDKLLEALPVAKEQGVEAALIEKGWRLGGDYLFGKEEWVGAILAYNKVRKHNPTIVYVFDQIIESVSAFYTQNKPEFSKNDLHKLVMPLQALIDFYRINFDNPIGLKAGEELILKVNYRIEFVAKEAAETKVSYRVNQIVDALDKDVPMKQVHADVAKILLPLIREKLRKKQSAHDKPDADTKTQN